MNAGLYLPNFGPFGDARLVSEIATEAEEAGWDGLFLWDHIARPIDFDVVDPWIALAAAAMTTSRMRLGALVTPIARRRPWKLARETASLDRLSGGRLIVGVGLGSSGGSEKEWEAFGEETDLRVRARMLDEGLELLTALWSGKKIDFEGNHYRAKGTRFIPTPMQQPRIPIWVAGYWPRKAPMRRAASWDGAFPLLGDELDGNERLAALTDCIAALESFRGGLAGFDVVHLAAPTQGVSRAQAGDVALPYSRAGVTWWLERLTPDGFAGDGSAQTAAEGSTGAAAEESSDAATEWSGEWPIDEMRAHIRRGPPTSA